MWTDIFRLFIVYIRIKHVLIPVILPLFILWGLVDAADDIAFIAGLFGCGRICRKAADVLRGIASEIASLGSFDFVDIEAGSVKVKVLLR